MALNGIQIFKLTPKKNCKGMWMPDMYGFLHESCTGRYEN